jgi:hypothetical protein
MIHPLLKFTGVCGLERVALAVPRWRRTLRSFPSRVKISTPKKGSKSILLACALEAALTLERFQAETTTSVDS